MAKSTAKSFLGALILIAGVVAIGWFLSQNQQSGSNNGSVDTSDWISHQDNAGFSYKYPAEFGPNFMSVEEWPPTLSVVDGSFSCANQVRKINSHTYCVLSQSEGAAGSIYTSYVYTTEQAGKLATASLTVRAVQCANYDDPNKTACENERTSFDLDGLIDNIIRTITLTP